MKLGWKGKNKMDAVQKWNNQLKAQEIVEILNQHKFDAIYAPTIENAKEILRDMLSAGATIAVGGSVTLSSSGILDEIIRDRKYNFIDRYQAENYEHMLALYREGLTSDVFVSSVNAITKNGQLVCLDCTGNRVSSIIFGPKKVIIIAGVNKICDTLEEGIARAKKIAPMNARRISHTEAPCYCDGKCRPEQCTMHERVCNNIGIVDGCYYEPGRITVIIIPEELGY